LKILLLGLGRATMPIARYALQRGDELYLYEEHPENLSDTARDLIRTGKIGNHENRPYDLVVASPGFPDSKPIITGMRAEGARIIDEIEFTYVHLSEPRVIAVTGTNGKSTTVALISSILKRAGIRSFLGGNISPGTPFSHALFQDPYDYYVLEVSSFQLMRIEKFHPRIAVLTNIGIDHLNWHRSAEEYAGAKAQIFKNQTPADFAVLWKDDQHTRKLVGRIAARVVYFGSAATGGAWLNGRFHYLDEPLFPAKDLPLRGTHNRLNIMAAIAVAKILDVGNDAIERGIRNFTTLPHRLEEVAAGGTVKYINNSMCTNEMAAIASFNAVPGTKIVIIGGRTKGDQAHGYLDLLMSEAKACVALGDNALEIAQYFRAKGYTRFAIAKDMDDAVIKSRMFAAPDDTIMLNPGFASFGLFRDFADRGEAFKNAVGKNR
jgi:UDP-N-acetylmuramoylalanine--D-glutamate ligase